MKRRKHDIIQLRLNPRHIEAARKIGDGGISAGITAAVRHALAESNRAARVFAVDESELWRPLDRRTNYQTPHAEAVCNVGILETRANNARGIPEPVEDADGYWPGYAPRDGYKSAVVAWALQQFDKMLSIVS